MVRGESGDITLASYEAAAERYRRQTETPRPPVNDFLDRFIERVGAGHVLELGSGPGRDATYLERSGLRVTRTDGASAFVEMMRADGHEVRLLDVRTGDLGGPYDAVLADAVFLHLNRDEFADVARRAYDAVVEGGVLAVTMKEGDGEEWTYARLDLPRHFTYWREPAVRDVLARAGWSVLSVDHVPGRFEPWLHILAWAPGNRDQFAHAGTGPPVSAR